ncbi:MAG: tail fiber domain-containing protein [Acidobacteria bacterium]|nr:tail fiber domain-containing protein [Acidobacteriota bacterium]
MIRTLAAVALFTASTLLLGSSPASAQSLGTFNWGLAPFCNIVTLTITQEGSVFRLDGYDNQCSFPQRAPVTGVATFNPDGTVGFGFTIVTAPGGVPVHVEARVSATDLNGPWTDSAGNTGTFTFGAVPQSGTARPTPVPPVIPAPITLLTEGGFVARCTGCSGAIPASGSGVRMMWYPQQAAFRAGAVQGTQWDAGNIGFASTALGQDVIASGPYSVALGHTTKAVGPFSTAAGLNTNAGGYAATTLGQNTTASGSAATAIGLGTTASGAAATALGQNTTASGMRSLAAGFSSIASGLDSVAFGQNGSTASGETSFAAGFNAQASAPYSRSWGYNTVASGVSSTAIGVGTHAAGLGSMAIGTFSAVSAAAPGSFVFGDRSTVGSGGVVTSVSPNQFLVRAAGGTAFWSSAGTVFPTSPGVILFAGDSAWSSLSDVNAKENFRDLATDDVLARIAAMPVREWNYRAQDQAIRHIGPTAQDFHAAFGLGQDERRISTIDADGVALAGVKALEARTRADNERLTRENDELRATLAAVQERLAALEARRPQ